MAGAAAAARPSRLSRGVRRRRVAGLHAAGYTIREIACTLGCAVCTVDRDIGELGLRTRTADAAPAHRPTGERGAAVVPRSKTTADLAAEVGALAHAYAQGVRRDYEQQLADLRRRHTQELAAVKARGERLARDLQARLAVETGRVCELLDRVGDAERRAQLAIRERQVFEHHLTSAELVRVAPPVA